MSQTPFLLGTPHSQVPQVPNLRSLQPDVDVLAAERSKALRHVADVEQAGGEAPGVRFCATAGPKARAAPSAVVEEVRDVQGVAVQH